MLAYVFAAQHLPQVRAMPLSLDDLIKAAQNGTHYNITTPDGFTVQADGADDHRRAMEALQALSSAKALAGGVSTHQKTGTAQQCHRSR